MTDDDLRARGAATMLAAWERYARGPAGAALHHLPGVTAAVFASGPERALFNNALLDRDLDAACRDAAIDAMEEAYDAAGVARFAAWVDERDAATAAALVARGYTLEETTAAMGMLLADVPPERPGADIVPATWREHLGIIEVPGDLLADADTDGFHALMATLEGEGVATAIALDHRGDTGVFNVGTLERARRRGLGTALTLRHLHDAAARGCSTASLQSSPMAERLYAALGFRDLGRFLEFVPRASAWTPDAPRDVRPARDPGTAPPSP